MQSVYKIFIENLYLPVASSAGCDDARCLAPKRFPQAAVTKHYLPYLRSVILVLAIVCDLIVSKVDFKKCNIVHYAHVLSLYFYKDTSGRLVLVRSVSSVCLCLGRPKNRSLARKSV